jgi:hypothetical protein
VGFVLSTGIGLSPVEGSGHHEISAVTQVSIKSVLASAKLFTSLGQGEYVNGQSSVSAALAPGEQGTLRKGTFEVRGRTERGGQMGHNQRRAQIKRLWAETL